MRNSQQAAERLLQAAEAVRIAHATERKLHRVEAKVTAGHENLVGHRDRLAATLGRRS